MISIGSGKSVEILHGFSSQDLALCSNLWSYRCSSGDSSHGLNNIGPSLAHDDALCRFHSSTHKHTSRPSRLHLVSSAPSVINEITKTRHLDSPGLTCQTHVGCVTIMCFTFVEEQEKIGTILNQPGQQRTSRFQGKHWMGIYPTQIFPFSSLTVA